MTGGVHVSEKVNKANDLYEFEGYYVKTMALTGSRDSNQRIFTTEPQGIAGGYCNKI